MKPTTKFLAAMLHALAACLTSGLANIAAARGVTLKSVEATIEGEIDIQGILAKVQPSVVAIEIEQERKAKEKAEAIRKRLLAGEPFPRLAADLSDAPSKANGGLIGPLTRDELAPTLLEQLDALQPGEITDVIRTTAGYQIFKLESRTETRGSVSTRAASRFLVGVASSEHSTCASGATFWFTLSPALEDPSSPGPSS